MVAHTALYLLVVSCDRIISAPDIAGHARR
jgi:hypothetical protein